MRYTLPLSEGIERRQRHGGLLPDHGVRRHLLREPSRTRKDGEVMPLIILCFAAPSTAARKPFSVWEY
jgi:hypothetical protein